MQDDVVYREAFADKLAVAGNGGFENKPLGLFKLSRENGRDALGDLIGLYIG